MELLPVEVIKVTQTKINKIDHLVKSIYRLIIYRRHHLDNDLLDTYLSGIYKLIALLSVNDLYSPIFINDAAQKKEYITTLSKSFRQLNNFPNKRNEHTENFFEQELDRFLVNVTLLYEAVNKNPI